MLLAKFPIGKQFLAMEFGPVEDEFHRAARQFAVHQVESGDVDHRPVLTILSVKMRRRVLVKEGACSLKNMRMTMPKNLLMIGTTTPQPLSASR